MSGGVPAIHSLLLPYNLSPPKSIPPCEFDGDAAPGVGNPFACPAVSYAIEESTDCKSPTRSKPLIGCA